MRSPRGAPSREPTEAGQPWYLPLAILTALTLRAVSRLALRQTEGLIGSVIRLLGLDLPVPDHTTLSRRADGLDVPHPQSRAGANGMHLIVDSSGLQTGNFAFQCMILISQMLPFASLERFFLRQSSDILRER
jgi:Transposase DDE domain